MGVSWRNALDQAPVLLSLAQLGLQSLRPSGPRPTVPGPEHKVRVRPPPERLVRAFAHHVGVELNHGLPPALFPFWCFPLTARILRPVRHPMALAVNAGCSVRIHAALPRGEPLEVTGRLWSIDEDVRRVVVKQRFVTSTSSARNALETEIVLLLRRASSKQPSTGSAPRPVVPSNAESWGTFSVDPGDALDFAKLTGDFNPLHWSPRYARLLGFEGSILHGFSIFARAWGFAEKRLGGGRIVGADCRFTRALVLPASGQVFGHNGSLWVAERAGSLPWLEGQIEVSGEPGA